MTQQKNAQAYAVQALSLLDLTSLNDNDTQERIHGLIDSINPAYPLPAAICIYPQFIEAATRYLAEKGYQSIKVATVTNFPSGDQPLTQVIAHTEHAMLAGADEIDLVLPYQLVKQRQLQQAQQYVEQSKAVCADKAKLKVIIESGELTPEQITNACEVAIAGGADFVKTSTGKVAINATLDAAKLMLTAIKNSGKNVGFKASGGVKNLADARDYLQLGEQIMGENWLTAAHFRFGASSLLAELYSELG